MSVTPIRIRRAPVTEVEILKARYDEARQIKDAWDHRYKRALYEHSSTIRSGGDFADTRRNLDAVEIQVADAAGELKVALNAWMHATTQHERRAS
ncbi:hypothetical protein [Arthrobacter sp. ISL-69]|uniref:hypothetical protein n=1 Tax=Arthrobacter sp. ISL-69 TaxID=2819113 RepID=UPI001BE9F092|nr:hypothetical protein [Arthrobacter sp. ISL-69]MBT2537245.1 hypothetical protein [Arthrobacter sp. ISL-69]